MFFPSTKRFYFPSRALGSQKFPSRVGDGQEMPCKLFHIKKPPEKDQKCTKIFQAISYAFWFMKYFPCENAGGVVLVGFFYNLESYTHILYLILTIPCNYAQHHSMCVLYCSVQSYSISLPNGALVLYLQLLLGFGIHFSL